MSLTKNMLRFIALLTLLCALFSSGCSYFRLPVLQGNIVDYEKAEKLQLGMTPAQVEFLLGTPLIQDSFGAARWDYVVYYRSPDAEVLQRNISVYFENDQVSRIDGRDEMLATWRKQKAIIEKAKKEKELLETPHPGQFPAEAGGAPVDAAGNKDEHAVLPPRDPETRQEILEEQPASRTMQPEDDETSVPTPPQSAQPTQSNEPIESPEATQDSGNSDSSSNASQGNSAEQNTDSGQNTEADYPPDMSTIYQSR
ncbi:MAG: outer membrane protein assembly factor BamE [Nevskiales bacterium]